MTKQQKLIFSGLLCGMLLSSLTSTIISTALPKIMSALNGLAYLNWVVTAYMLTSTLAIPLVGKLTDLYGRKPFYLAGITIFLVGSFLCGSAQNIWQLIIYRGFTGIGGGIMMACAVIIIADIFPPAERGRYQGITGSVFGLSSILGPLLGGYITDHLGWRWIFFINGPLGLLALIILALYLPNFKPRKNKPTLDYLGGFLLIVIFLTLLSALSLSGKPASIGLDKILYALALLSLIFFIRTEKKAAEPFVPLWLFSNTVYTVAIISSFLSGFALFGAIMFLPLFIQGVIGLSASASGLSTAPMMISLVLASTAAGFLITKQGHYRKLAIFGFALILVGLLLLSFMTTATTISSLILNICLIGLGLGITMPVMVIAVQNAFPHRHLGVVSSSVQFFRNVGGMCGVAIMGSFLNYRYQFYTANMLDAKLLSRLTKLQQTALAGSPQELFRSQHLTRLNLYVDGNAGAILAHLKIALATAMQDLFLICSALILIAMLVSFFLQELPLRKNNHLPPAEEAGRELFTEGLPGTMIPPETKL